MDDDYDLYLNYGQFRKALKDYKTGLSEEESRIIFSFLDTERNGKVYIDTIIMSIRGEMNNFRRNIVI